MKNIKVYSVISSLLLLTVYFSWKPSQAQLGGREYFLIESQYLDVAGKLVNTIQRTDQLALVEINSHDEEDLVRKLHLVRRSCGGIKNVTNDVEKYGFNQTLENHHARLRTQAVFDLKTPQYKTEVGFAISKIDKNRYWDYVKTLSSFTNRSGKTAEGESAAKSIKDKAAALAKAYNRSVDISEVSIPKWGYRQSSIVVKLPGQNSTLPAVAIGGHMDTLQNLMPGADDDATGSATVMEIYNLILENNFEFQRDIYFLYYAAEENGLVGSEYVVSELMKSSSFRGVVQFDMTGFQSKKAAYDIYFTMDNIDLNLTNYLKTLTTEYLSIPANKIGEIRCGYACSDHARWHNQGVPVAFPFEAGPNQYNSLIHTSQDVIANLSLDHALKYIKLGVAFVVEAAEPL